ncbi:MAG TPA: amino acid ABC transporter permease [Thiolinea sp.]|nr:amino acid ABC transporter permease [Thiolinea sp.]
MAAFITHETLPSLPPPNTLKGPVAWMRQNLFSNWINGAITVILVAGILAALIPFINWAFIKADWVGDSREACTSGGACWVFVGAHLKLFFLYIYPDAEVWRPLVVAIILALTLAGLMIKGVPFKKYIQIFALVFFPIIGFILLSGGHFNLPHVETNLWGGLMLTLVIAIVGIVAAFPLGILLALGRRSSMPIVKAMSVVFIEVWRGVPLITVLFMSSVMLPLFLPEGMEIDKLLRALVGITLFQSAYLAEVVRSGLQAIPKGQTEAANALGLTYWQGMYKVILPQALKIVIPGIVNSFISLFKDTSLVLIIGLFDFLATVQGAFASPKWLGYAIEGYLFAAFVYWIFCFSMSRYSQHVERSLKTTN